MLISGPFFKKSLIISVLSHITFFGLFSLSFGNKAKSGYAQVAFWGELYKTHQVNQPMLLPEQGAGDLSGNIALIKDFFGRKSEVVALERTATDIALKDRKSTINAVIFDIAKKPTVATGVSSEKKDFVVKKIDNPFPELRSESTVVFHPLLPQTFPLYFADRQVAHVELMFNIGGAGVGSRVTVKRKISSGNLEADLLTMRYMSHYLFIEQSKFAPESWQAIKIDLSEKND